MLSIRLNSASAVSKDLGDFSVEQIVNVRIVVCCRALELPFPGKGDFLLTSWILERPEESEGLKVWHPPFAPYCSNCVPPDPCRPLFFII